MFACSMYIIGDGLDDLFSRDRIVTNTLCLIGAMVEVNQRCHSISNARNWLVNRDEKSK